MNWNTAGSTFLGSKAGFTGSHPWLLILTPTLFAAPLLSYGCLCELRSQKQSQLQIQIYPKPSQNALSNSDPFQGLSSLSGPSTIVLVIMLGELWSEWKGRRWHHFSHLKKNNVRLHAQENSHIVKWQGNSDKASHCLFLDIIKRTTISNLHPRPVYPRGAPSCGASSKGSLHVLQHCPDYYQNLVSALEQKRSALLQNPALLYNFPVLVTSSNYVKTQDTYFLCDRHDFPEVYGLVNWLSTVIWP